MTTPPTSENPWEPLPEEPDDVYARFLKYRDLDPGRRGLTQVAESCGVSRQVISKQAATWQWRERVQSWDRHQADQRRGRIADGAVKLAVAEMDVARAMVQAVAKTVSAVLKQDGPVLEPAEAARWLDVAARVGKLAANQPELLVGITGADGGPIQVQVPELEGLSPEQARQRIGDAIGIVSRFADHVERREQGAA